MTKQKIETKPLVPAPAAALISAIIPGLGQILSFKFRRGILLFGSFVSIVGLFIWRIGLIAHREPDFISKFSKAFSRQPIYMAFLCIAIIGLWVWIIYDALNMSRGIRKKGIGIFTLVLVVFFVLGWQISEINVGKMLREFPDAWPPLSRILWPWEAAVTRDTVSVSAKASILVDSEDSPPPPPEYVEGEPYIKSTPTYGKMSSLDENNKITGFGLFGN